MVALLSCCAILIASWNVSVPGIYYDEILFGNAALLGQSDSFMHWRPLGIPVLLMPYIGALKAWIYLPIFQLFGVDPLTIRLPAILFGVAGAFFLVASVGIWFGRGAAVCCAFLTLLDPSLLMHSRLDWGPNALMFFFRGLAILGIAWWWKHRTPAGIWVALTACTLGGFDKLNFIWVSCALWFALIAVFRPEMRYYFSRYPQTGTWQSALIIVTTGFILFRAVVIGLSLDADPMPLFDRMGIALQLVQFTLVGGGPLDFISGDGMTPAQWMLPAYVFALSVAICGVALFWRQIAWRPYTFLLVFVLLLAAAFAFTDSATGPHHSAVLAGLPGVLLAPLLSSPIPQSKSRVTALTLNSLRILSTAAIAFAMAYTTIHSIRRFAEPENSNWDMAHNDLGQLFEKYPDAYFRTADWGMGTQLIALSRGKVKVNDQWPDFANQAKDSSDLLKSADGSPTIVLVRAAGQENFAKANAGAMHAISNSGKRSTEIDRFNDWRGQHLISAFLIEPAQ